MEVAFAVFEMTPDVFWKMTPIEYTALQSGRMKMRPDYVEPLSREEFEELEERFPDKHG